MPNSDEKRLANAPDQRLNELKKAWLNFKKRMEDFWQTTAP